MPFEKGKTPKGAILFKKGVSGNPKGAPHKIPNLDVAIANILGEIKDDKTALEVILIALRLKATKGDIRAAELLLDRAYGKSKQQLEISAAVISILENDPLDANHNSPT